MLAIVHALRQWRCYLQGPRFRIFTDNRSVTFAQTQKHLSSRIARSVEFLQEYTFDISHKPGKDNVVADALSQVNAITDASPSDCLIEHHNDWPLLMKEYLSTQQFPPHVSEKTRRKVTAQSSRFTIVDDAVHFIGKHGSVPFVPFVDQGPDRMLENHNGLGHFGEKATVDTMSRRMWWPGMPAEVSRFV